MCEAGVAQAAASVVLFTEQLYQPGLDSNKFLWAQAVLTEALRLEAQNRRQFTLLHGEHP